MAEILKDGFELFAVEEIRKYLELEKRLLSGVYGGHDVFRAVTAAEGLTEFPEIAEAITYAKQAIAKKNRIDLDEVEVTLETYRRLRAETDRYVPAMYDPFVTFRISEAIHKVLHHERRKAGLELVNFVGNEAEMDYLQSMGLKFAERSDLIRPFDDLPWDNLQRSFNLRIGQTSFKCTLVISNINERKCSFILERVSVPQKHSCMIDLTPHNIPRTPWNIPRLKSDTSEQSEMLAAFFDIARGTVLKFRGMSETVRDIHSGERYGLMDVFGMVAKIIRHSSGEEGVFDGATGEEAMAAYALSVDMAAISFYNNDLNALEYAALSVKDEKELQAVQQDEAAFIYHVMRGLIILFKKVLTIGATGESNILDGIDETGWAKISGNGDNDNGSTNAPVLDIDSPSQYGFQASAD